MRLSRWILVAVVFVGVAAMVLRDSLAQSATSRPVPAATRIATVDLLELFDNYRKAKDLLDGLNHRKNDSEAEDAKRKEGLDRIEAELSNLVPNSAEYEKRFNELQRQGIDREVWRNFDKAALAREYHRLTRDLYGEIRVAVAQVAKEQGIGIVFYSEHKDIPTTNMQDLSKVIETRKVLYSEPELDITETVLKRLNESSKTQPAGK